MAVIPTKVGIYFRGLIDSAFRANDTFADFKDSPLMGGYGVYLILVSLDAYFIGTIPWALIMVKALKGRSILAEGTGNVGAMNSYDITGSKLLAVIIFLLDMLKGAAAVLAAIIIHNLSSGFIPTHQFGNVWDDDFIYISLAAIFVILGHNYNIFLKFRGGRGLSSAVGIFLIINPMPIILWGLMWLAGLYIIKKDIHIANIVATVGLPILIFSTPDKLISFLNIVSIENILHFKILCLVLSLIVLIRHIKPLVEMIKNHNV